LKKPKGLSPYVKLLFQALAALILIHYDIYIKFLPQPWGYILTILWVTGITNAFNLLDIQDGLAAGHAALAAAAFAAVALPGEFIYVNFAATALIGATCAFWPYNHSASKKTFLGDAGSNFLGFILAALALGASYSKVSPLAVFAPLLILALPIFDTLFVSAVRLSKGISPLKGTPDHFPLRLLRLGLNKKTILILSLLTAGVYDILAYAAARCGAFWAGVIYAAVFLDLIFFAVFLKWKTE
ncbi:MAG: undecaprenyl/decaprenyl-phosphate alpha-N-acetylglucosaminyl 1-phosphate transferase, partial [Elusimicrobiota bacterium]|nr:undecaprenyl/decaprenyl-phosphate alpha-N-acetylglucosaminyl 1-phosphate transferase [Elusimicrobiota bacterium]